MLRTSRRRLGGAMRVALLLALMVASIGRFCLKEASARVELAVRELGNTLLSLGEAGLGTGRGIYINGQSLAFDVQLEEGSAEDVLARHEQECRQHNGDAGDWRDLTLRTGARGTGVVACLRVHPSEGGPLTDDRLVRRIQSAQKTGNIGDVGVYSFVAVREVGPLVRVVRVATIGDFFPGRMFPAEGDAPGFDIPEVTRPVGAKRILSAGEHDTDYTLVAYSSDLSNTEVARHYREQLVGLGSPVEIRSDGGVQVLQAQVGSSLFWIMSGQEGGQTSSVVVRAPAGSREAIAP